MSAHPSSIEAEKCKALIPHEERKENTPALIPHEERVTNTKTTNNTSS